MSRSSSGLLLFRGAEPDAPVPNDQMVSIGGGGTAPPATGPAMLICGGIVTAGSTTMLALCGVADSEVSVSATSATRGSSSMAPDMLAPSSTMGGIAFLSPIATFFAASSAADRLGGPAHHKVSWFQKAPRD